MEVKVISDAEVLGQHVSAWEELANAALEPNPFYEPWMFLPAFRNFDPERNVRVLFIFQNDPNSGAPVLCGMFPLERKRHYLGLPIAAWALWKYNHCPLTMPLIRKEYARDVLKAVFEWLASAEANCQMIELKYVPGEGPFHPLLIDQFHEMGTTPFVWEWFTRAFFRPMENAERYFSVALSGKHRKAFRRRAEQLSEMGPLNYVVAEPGADIEKWIECFLQIESSGWKGRERSAMACRDSNRNFFVEAVSGAFQRNRLLMSKLLVGSKTIAQNCYFLAGRGAFHFKPAFCEEYARFSPGFHMECELIRYLHGRPEIEWMDSCTSSDNEMYNRLFIARRTIQTLLVPISGVGDLMVSAIPLLRSLKKRTQSILGSLHSGNGKPSAAKSEKLEFVH